MRRFLAAGLLLLPICSLSLQKECVDIKLLVCVPNAALHADIFLLGRAVSKVRCVSCNVQCKTVPEL